MSSFALPGCFDYRLRNQKLMTLNITSVQNLCLIKIQKKINEFILVTQLLNTLIKFQVQSILSPIYISNLVTGFFAFIHITRMSTKTLWYILLPRVWIYYYTHPPDWQSQFLQKNFDIWLGDVRNKIYNIKIPFTMKYDVWTISSFAHLGDGENSWITDKCPYITPAL